jgi:hypothetical protein
MKRILIALAALAFMAVPASAVVLDTEDVGVTINVAAYGAITDLGSSPLTFTVSGPLGTGTYGVTDDFTVLTNTSCTLTVTAPVVTPWTAPPGSPGEFYPTATILNSSPAEQIGFGVALTNLVGGQYGAWNGQDNPGGQAQVNIAPSLKTDPAKNVLITLNSYTDSARGGRALAIPGSYTTTLTVTLATSP